VKTKEAVREFFDKNVEEWDVQRYQDETYVSRGRVALRWLTAMKPGKRVLDMGCGTGHQTLALLNHGHDVVAADFSEQMARATRQRILKERPGQPARVIVADALNPPFREGTFDVVMALGVVGFIKDRPSMLRSVYGILTDKGTLVCDAGVPEEHVLFQMISRKLTRVIEVLFRMKPSPARKGWYSQNFIKHTPLVFERLLEGAGFKPVARGGGGFGDLKIRATSIVPWRVQCTIARVLSNASMSPAGGMIARRALTYVVRSTK
jgi:ubiquinone/menaquinone biosynthesis C-methylase UbiE